MRKLLALAGVLACVACGGSGGAKVTAQVVGGQARERALAREILQKLAPSPVSVVRFRGYQHDASHHWPGRRMDVSHAEDTVGADWEESIFAYTYALVARERHIPIGYVSLDIGNGLLDNALASAPRQAIPDSQLHAFESRLRAAAKSPHASIAFRELRAGPVALEATLTVPHPAQYLVHRLEPFYELWQHRPGGMLGLLFSVDDSQGGLAFADGLSPGGSSAGGTLFPECTEPSWPMFYSAPSEVRVRRCPARA